uniref:Uncharacterized protein n=1 Tax=Arundo donax TaxID=35708 RepID=A0A0A9EEE8_ARUDO
MPRWPLFMMSSGSGRASAVAEAASRTK